MILTLTICILYTPPYTSQDIRLDTSFCKMSKQVAFFPPFIFFFYFVTNRIKLIQLLLRNECRKVLTVSILY